MTKRKRDKSGRFISAKTVSKKPDDSRPLYRRLRGRRIRVDR
jgi:hypothetical protein